MARFFFDVIYGQACNVITTALSSKDGLSAGEVSRVLAVIARDELRSDNTVPCP